MAYIGKSPVIGNFVKLDAITAVNGQAAYTMQNGGSNFTDYESVNQFLVSLNGTIQAPTDSFTVSGSTLTFASNLSTGDVIDFIMVFGNSLSAGTPTDGTVSLAKLSATGTKDATTFLRGDNTFASAGLSGWSENGSNNDLLPANASAGIYLGVNSATAANLLDDYEEGTWSPTSGSTVLTNAGFYRKIGSLCFIHFGNQASAAFAASDDGTIGITGLPFSMAASDWNYGSVPSASFADASASYYSQPLTGRQTNSNAIHLANRSGINMATDDPVNLAMVYITN